MTPLGGTPFSSPVALSTAPLTAPATATVVFDATAFKAIPKPAPVARVESAPSGSAFVVTPKSTSKPKSSSGSSSKGSSGGGSAAAAGSSVLSVAAKYVGTPYRSGGSTPSGFDCSGYTSYVYKQLGIHIPRTANAQYGANKHISKSQAKPGDLVFFLSGSHAYHVGIYAGGNKMYDSPKPGKSISKRDIWSSSAKFGRVT